MKRLIICLYALFIVFPALSQENIAITHGPYLQHVGETGATIVWTTNKDAVSWVELAPDDNTHFYQEERPKFFAAPYGFKQIGKTHAVRLENLKLGTTYRYRVYSQEVLDYQGIHVTYGRVAATAIYRSRPLEFTTFDHTKKDVSFVVVNDIHGNNALLSSLLKTADYENADLIFFNGDMVNDLRSEQQMFDGFMDTAIQIFAKEKPMFYARGNHETRGVFANAFPQYFPSPDGKLYYLVRQGPVCFVVMDCGEDKPDSDIEYSGIVAFDAYRDAQKQWLEKALKEEMFVSAPIKVAIIHMPPFGGWHGELDVLKKFVPPLNEAGIDVMLCGHLHRYVTAEPNENVNFPVIVNANTTVVKAYTEGGKLFIKILNDKGATVDSFVFGK